MNDFSHTTINSSLSIRIFFNRGKEEKNSLLGLKFRVVMSTNQEISDSDIFLNLALL